MLTAETTTPLPRAGHGAFVGSIDRGYRRDATIHQLFEEQTERTPGLTAVVCGSEQITYRELNERSNRLARYLKACGLRRGAAVAISTVRSVEMVVGLLAILKAGAAYVPLNFDFPSNWLRQRLEDVRPGAILTQHCFINRLPQIDGQIVSLDEKECFASFRSESLSITVTADDLAYVMFTSGSTGEPKGVEVPHRGVVRLLCGIDYATLDKGVVVLQHSPLSFDASTFEIWAPLLYGGRLVLLPPAASTPATLEEALKANKVTTLWPTSSLFNLIIEERPMALSGLKELLIGGEALSVSHVRRALALLPDTTLINGYGPTESTTFACCYRIPRSLEASLKSIPIGLPINNTQVAILNADGEPAALGETGEICISGDGLARGYLNHPELTAEKFVTAEVAGEAARRMYRSGDLGRYLDDGAIEFKGRTDRQFKIHGLRIEPGEIEMLLERHSGVRRCVVVAKEDATRGPRLVAYVIRAEGTPFAIDGLREFLRESVPDYMVPAAFVEISRLPLTSSGKLDVSALPPAPPQSTSREREAIGPRDECEKRLIEIWKRILGLSTISVTDDFFLLGGDSLRSLRLCVHIEREFNRSFQPAYLAEPCTIAKLADILRGETLSGHADRKSDFLVQLSAGEAPPPLFCLPGLGGDVSRFRKLAELIGVSHGVQGVLLPDFSRASEIPRSMEELAAFAIAEIRRVQPEGPYFLAGYSFGGSVAYEMAQQITASGEQVAFLALWDAELNSQKFRTSISRFLLQVRGVASWPLRTKMVYVRGSLLRGMRRFVKPRSISSPSKPADDGDDDESRVIEKIVQFQSTALKIYCAYKHRPYDGRIHIFRAVERTPFEELTQRRNLSSWLSLAKGGLAVHALSGTHNTLFVEPHVSGFAKIVHQCMVEARHGNQFKP